MYCPCMFVIHPTLIAKDLMDQLTAQKHAVIEFSVLWQTWARDPFIKIK